jgi:hypothetical protein
MEPDAADKAPALVLMNNFVPVKGSHFLQTGKQKKM